MTINKVIQGFVWCCLLVSLPAFARKVCSTPDLADSYMIAISWQPAFCETHKSKHECKKMEQLYVTNPHHGPSFTLHGLWPNKRECGKNYGYCGKNEKLNIADNTLEVLATVMPNVKFGGDLLQYEWDKHGTCQTKWTAEQYFRIAANLVNDFSHTKIVHDFMSKYMGKKVAKKELISAFKQGFGPNFVNHVTLQCNHKMLTEIRIELPKDLREGETLTTLVNRSAGQGLKSGACGKTFVIDQWGKSIEDELINK